MLDALKRLFGGEPQPQEQVEEPLTQDDLLRQYVEQFQRATEEEKQRYMSEIEKLSQIPETKMEFPSSKSMDEERRKDREPEPTLSQDPTVEELVEFITNRVTKALEEKIAKIQPTMPVSPASFLVERIVRKHPQLENVADEAVTLLEKLPPQYQTQESADFLLWWLKGKRSEIEKKEAVSDILSTFNRQSEAPSAVLPYTNAEIEAYAEAMGIDPKQFKKRLLEMQGGEK